MRGDRGNVWRGGDYEVLGLWGERERRGGMRHWFGVSEVSPTSLLYILAVIF